MLSLSMEELVRCDALHPAGTGRLPLSAGMHARSLLLLARTKSPQAKERMLKQASDR